MQHIFESYLFVSVITILGSLVSAEFYNNKPAPHYSLTNMPRTSFSCRGKILGGYYADAETQCQMFHVCVKVAGVGVSRSPYQVFKCDMNFTIYIRKSTRSSSIWNPPIAPSQSLDISRFTMTKYHYQKTHIRSRMMRGCRL